MSAIERAVKLCGGQKALGDKIGVHKALVNQWVKGKRPIPGKRCQAIEAATNGLVRCEELRPDLDWVRFRGTVTHYKVPVKAAA